MIGHLKPRHCDLPQAARVEYRTLYCSLCVSLRRQFGLLHSLLVNNEATMLLLALRQHFVPSTEHSLCLIRPYRLRPVLFHPIIDKAARYSAVLAYMKALDYETDGRPRVGRLIRRGLEGRASAIMDGSPPALAHIFREYCSAIVRADDSEAVISGTGSLAVGIAADLAETTSLSCEQSDILAGLFGSVGELVTIGDALLDLRSDVRSQRRNPILRAAHAEGTTLYGQYRRFSDRFDGIVAVVRQRLARERETFHPLFAATMEISLHRLSQKVIAGEQELVGSGIEVAGLSTGFPLQRSFPARQAFVLGSFAGATSLCFSTEETDLSTGGPLKKGKKALNEGACCDASCCDGACCDCGDCCSGCNCCD